MRLHNMIGISVTLRMLDPVSGFEHTFWIRWQLQVYQKTYMWDLFIRKQIFFVIIPHSHVGPISEKAPTALCPAPPLHRPLFLDPKLGPASTY